MSQERKVARRQRAIDCCAGFFFGAAVSNFITIFVFMVNT